MGTIIVIIILLLFSTQSVILLVHFNSILQKIALKKKYLFNDKLFIACLRWYLLLWSVGKQFIKRTSLANTTEYSTACSGILSFVFDRCVCPLSVLSALLGLSLSLAGLWTPMQKWVLQSCGAFRSKDGHSENPRRNLFFKV